MKDENNCNNEKYAKGNSVYIYDVHFINVFVQCYREHSEAFSINCRERYDIGLWRCQMVSTEYGLTCWSVYIYIYIFIHIHIFILPIINPSQRRLSQVLCSKVIISTMGSMCRQVISGDVIDILGQIWPSLWEKFMMKNRKCVFIFRKGIQHDKGLVYWKFGIYIDGLVQDCSNSISNAL